MAGSLEHCRRMWGLPEGRKQWEVGRGLRAVWTGLQSDDPRSTRKNTLTFASNTACVCLMLFSSDKIAVRTSSDMIRLCCKQIEVGLMKSGVSVQLLLTDYVVGREADC